MFPSGFPLRKFLVMPPISVRLVGGQSLYVSLFQGKLMRSITAVTLFLFTVLGATASHATYTWTTLDHPSATYGTYLTGIDGANMVGSYTDSSGTHGFMVTATSPVPEPAAILLALLGLALLPRRRRR